jgi:hypothetical protein
MPLSSGLHLRLWVGSFLLGLPQSHPRPATSFIVRRIELIELECGRRELSYASAERVRTTGPPRIRAGVRRGIRIVTNMGAANPSAVDPLLCHGPISTGHRLQNCSTKRAWLCRRLQADRLSRKEAAHYPATVAWWRERRATGVAMALFACCLRGNAPRAAKDGSRRACRRRNSRKCRNHRARCPWRDFVQPDLARRLGRWRDRETPAVIFLINGSSVRAFAVDGERG